MAKMKRPAKWDNCPYALTPFGNGWALCTYGMKLTAQLSLKDFPICMHNNICPKEKAEKDFNDN